MLQDSSKGFDRFKLSGVSTWYLKQQSGEAGSGNRKDPRACKQLFCLRHQGASTTLPQSGLRFWLSCRLASCHRTLNMLDQCKESGTASLT